MKSKINIVVPHGMLGSDDLDDAMDSALRSIAIAASQNATQEWASKYGTDFENDVFIMRRYCWCEKDDCKWCNEEYAPNFLYKPSGFSVHWYKYIGRGMEFNQELSTEDLNKMVADCHASLLKKPA